MTGDNLANVYSIDNRGGLLRGCIDLCYSPDDGGWYAQQYNFKNNATRTSRQIFSTREQLLAALNSGTHRWQKWD